MEADERAAAQAFADLLLNTRHPRTFKTLWGAQDETGQARALRILAAWTARAVPDGIHHRSYRSIDADLDAALCAVVEAVRHRLPERGRIARTVLRELGARSHNAPWRLSTILLDATRH